MVPKVKSGEPPQPNNNCARRNSKTGPVVDGVPSIQFSRKLLWGAKGGADRPVTLENK